MRWLRSWAKRPLLRHLRQQHLKARPWGTDEGTRYSRVRAYHRALHSKGDSK